jgi:hypothetical protein
VGAGSAEVLASGDFDQFGDPGLGVDEGLAPLFAVDERGFGARSCAVACGCDGGLHVGDEGFGLGLRVDMRSDEADVFVDVSERVRSECEDGQTGFEDRGE